MMMAPVSDVERRDFLEITEDRYQFGTTIIASQCPIGDWHPNIGDPTLADAIMDRLLQVNLVLCYRVVCQRFISGGSPAL